MGGNFPERISLFPLRVHLDSTRRPIIGRVFVPLIGEHGRTKFTFHLRNPSNHHITARDRSLSYPRLNPTPRALTPY